MAVTEFIIALIGHRFLGNVFVPYLIQKEEQFYTVINHVKPRDFKTETDYKFKPYEKELVEIIEKYSDDRLKKKFSNAASVKEFYAELKPEHFKKFILPHIEKCLIRVASILMVSPVRLLNKEMKYANLYDEDEIQVQPFFARPAFYFERNETETRYRLKIFHNEKEIKLFKSIIRVVTNDPCVFVQQNKMFVFEDLNAKRLTPFLEKEFVVIPHALEEKYYGGFILNTVRDFEVHASGFTLNEGNAEKNAVLALERNLEYQPRLVLYFQYDNEKFQPNSTRKVAVQFQKENNNYVFRKVKRDFDWETEVQNFLTEFGLTESDGYLSLPGLDLLENENAVYFLVNWLNRNKPELDKNNIRITQENFDKKYFTGLQQIKLKTQQRGDWFDIYAMVHFGEFIIPFIKLKRFLLNDIREFELPNGEIAILPKEWFARYKGLIPLAKMAGDKLQFEKHHYFLLKNKLKEAVESVTDKLSLFESPEKSGLSIPDNLKAQLRNYQFDGYFWMHQLHKNGFGGCLADDMGLGKTLQTLTLLLKLKREKTGVTIRNPVAINGQLDLFAQQSNPVEVNCQPASLIVIPTSLVHNWDNEIRKFTPSLKVYKYVGSQRNKAINLTQVASFYDVILTTYGTVRNDIKTMTGTPFFYAILDESQFIKNPESKTYKSIMQLRATHRLVLTGTPIENSLSDLWAQMNFLNSGLLGSHIWFQKTFMAPIEKHSDPEQQKILQLLISQFILRRKKEEVARELPPLTEHVVFCRMAEEQEKLYEEAKSVIRNAILENIEKEGIKKSSFVVLQGLTKLRQLANHPSMLDKESEDVSGKFEQMLSMLENLVAENHKVLVFSSFVTHLQLIEERIIQQNWRYSLLTGKTTDREKVIGQFQDDPENYIFLISLKAGGVGLNLTAAEYVFITDPWWNPASENQAISRAHRIGQQKNVFVYRFITENSIEEKIQVLKERKSSLADKFINSNDPFKEITKEEIVELFK
ncbi:MAG: SNF2-like [Prolixibacteraceae bacterium]|nr:MAG: SNF2-like [Prolixibacteraceae bacterium]